MSDVRCLGLVASEAPLLVSSQAYQGPATGVSISDGSFVIQAHQQRRTPLNVG